MATGNDAEAVRYDLVVAGAGYVGLATALAVKAGRPGLRVAVADPAPAGAASRDGRASAVAAAAVRMLRTLGVWERLEAEAQPITEMIVTDSRRADPVRPVFLTFGGDVAPGEPFAHMVANGALNGALRERAQALGVSFIEGAGVEGFAAGPAAVTLRLSDGRALEAGLLAAADGVRSRLRQLAGIRTVHWDYRQSGIVCTVRHERPHGGRAEEHFLPAGPFAILPLKTGADGAHRSSIVWTESRDEAERLLASDPLLFEVELEERFGLKLGEIHAEGSPKAWPLSLTLARDFVRPRFALVGDSAHGIHPIAGQGLNLGFKDAAALAETVVEADRMGRDIGSLDALRDYERWRRPDTVRLGATTDLLNRLFSNDSTPLRLARDIGLGLVERMPSLKGFFIGEAAGLSAGAPRLLRGEPI